MAQTALTSDAPRSETRVRKPTFWNTLPQQIGRGLRAAVRGVIRARWHLAPLWAGALVWAVGYTYPLAVALPLAFVAGLAYRWREPSGKRRTRLSERERLTLSAWAAAAAAWAVVGMVVTLEPRWSAGMLALLTAWPAVRWATSRTIRRRHRLTGEARALVAAWGSVVAVMGHDRLHGSHVIPGTVTVPGEGAVTFDVRTSGSHAKYATTSDVQDATEALLDLPSGTLTLAPVRENARTLRVTISPRRHMEVAPVAWQGAVLEPDGRIPIAETDSGRVGYWRAHDEKGVMHGWISGPSNSGKSTDLTDIVLPLVLSGKWVVIYLDGGKGTSLPAWLRPAMTHVAKTPDEWSAAIRAAHAILDARQDRRDGIDCWNIHDEDDPAILVIADEATNINRYLPDSDIQRFVYIAEAGRKAATHAIQLTQNPSAASLIGGVAYKTNASQMIAHRPQTASDGRLAAGSSRQEINLLALPEQPGWAAVISNGAVTFPARVRYVTSEQGARAMDGFRARQLTGADWDAARPFLDPDSVVIDAPETPEQRQTSRDRLVQVLTAHGPSLVGQIAPDDGDGARPHATCDTPGCPGWALGRKQTYTHLNALHGEGVLGKEGTSWFVVSPSPPRP